MYTEVELAPRVQEYLESLDRPVRVLKGSAWTFAPPGTWRGVSGNYRQNLTECNETGITLVSWGTDEVDVGNPYQYYRNMPGTFYVDGEAREMDAEWLRPINTSGPATLATEDDTFARIGERTVFYNFPLDKLSDGDGNLDLEMLFGEPIQRASTIGEALAAERRERQEREAAERAERERAQAEREAAAAREAFVQRMANRFSTQRQSLEAQRVQGERYVTEYEQYVRQYRDQVRQAVAQLEMIDRAGEQQIDYDAQWEELSNHPRVKRLGMEDNYFTIYTDLITITSPESGESWPLGEMCIKLPPPGQYDIRIRNLTNRMQDGEGSRDHPHVVNEGPCFGDIGQLVEELNARGDIPGLFEVLIQYLESYNPADSWGRAIRLWREQSARTTPVAVQTNVDYNDDYDNERDDPGYDPGADCNCYECRQARR